MRGVSSNGDVAIHSVLMLGKYIQAFKMNMFLNSAPKRVQNIIQCHDNNI